MPITWHEIVEQNPQQPVAVSRDRVRWLLAGFAVALCVIVGRAVQLEISDGENFRRLAARPIEREVALPAARGRIVSRDGSILAAELPTTALAVHFRYLQDPPDPSWLRRRARARLTAVERRNSVHTSAMEARVRAELSDLHQRLAQLCDVPPEHWKARARRIDRRVTALSQRVNQRRRTRHREATASAQSAPPSAWGRALSGMFSPPAPFPPTPIVVVEETAYHRLADDVPPSVVAQINDHPDRYPGVKIVEHTSRQYLSGTLAANVLGHVGRTSGIESQVATDSRQQDADVAIGLMGVERIFNAQLAGRGGRAVQSTNRRGKVLASRVVRQPVDGRDVVLTIDVPLQRFAETWLDHRRRRRPNSPDEPRSASFGGAALVLDVYSGALLVAASAPRFDPNLFVAGDPRVDRALHDPARPMFDRAVKMALPPGSVFKALTALALVSQEAVDPEATFRCQGYYEDPSRLRCRIFRQSGENHGELRLADALGQSCNVYFFEHARSLGGPRLVDWASRFGLGRPTGIELPDEAAGQLPSHDALRGPSQTQLLSVGQGALTATPLQVVRLYAAIANGGYLVRPRITRDRPVRAAMAPGVRPPLPSESLRVPGLSEHAIRAVHKGLLRAVDDPLGTAFATVRLSGLAIAAKTGTAETGSVHGDHAWLAGYVPADEPRYAFVVVLEHGGSGGEQAGPVASALIERMRALGYFGPRHTADKAYPPGKG